MKTRIDAHDDVALRDEETIAWWAMAHNMDDDRVPCNTIVMECPCEAEWSYQCGCAKHWTLCEVHRTRADVNQLLMCIDCRAVVPSPLPWLPM